MSDDHYRLSMLALAAAQAMGMVDALLDTAVKGHYLSAQHVRCLREEQYAIESRIAEAIGVTVNELRRPCLEERTG